METSKGLDFLATLFPLAVIIFIIAVGVVLLTQQFHKNQYRAKLKQEELKNLHQVELLRSSIQAQEDERKRIAQDMHDELGAVLSITKMHLQQLEEQEKDDAGSLLPALQNIRSLTEASLASMRRISHELMPPQLEKFGLVKTLEAFAIQAGKNGNIHIQIINEEPLPELEWPVTIGLYRVVLELMNNTFKHAGAKNITIHLEQACGYTTCTYADDGIGLTGKERPGMGSMSMEGRIKVLGGTITHNAVATGFSAVINIPVKAWCQPGI